MAADVILFPFIMYIIMLVIKNVQEEQINGYMILDLMIIFIGMIMDFVMFVVVIFLEAQKIYYGLAVTLKHLYVENLHPRLNLGK